MYLGDIHNILDHQNNPLAILFVRPFDMVRFFAHIVQRLIFVVFYPFFSWNISANFGLYTFSLFVMPYICLFLNFVFAKRTLRYDIAIFALLTFCLFTIPYSAWLTRELPVSLMLQFLLLQFFLSRKKYNKTDLIIISFLILFNFESFENMAILSILFIIFGFIYYKNKVINYKVKLLIAILNIFIFFHIAYGTLYAVLYYEPLDRIYDNIIPWVHYLLMLNDATWRTCMIVSIISFLLILFCMKFSFSKIKFNLITLFTFIFAIIVLFIKTNFIPLPRTESNLFMYTIFISPIIFFLFMFFDLKKIKIKKDNLREILIVVLITGCIQTLWQINSCRYFYQYYQTLKTCMENSEKRFLSYHFENDSILSNFDVANTNIIQSIIVVNGYCKNLMVTDKKHIDYSDKLYKGFENYYDEEHKQLCLLGICYRTKNKFWDLRSLVETNPETLQEDLENLNYLYK